jgi:hypothetical protein
MKTLIITAVALLGVAGSAVAQGITAQGTATASLDVVSGISITKDADPDFGNIAQGQGTVTLDNTGALTSSSGITSQTDATVGKFSVTGFSTAQFSISTSNATLTGPGTAITFTPTLYGNGTDNAAAATSGVTSGTLVDDAGTGKYFIYVGGSVAVPAGQTVGAYSGTVTVDVAYTSI